MKVTLGDFAYARSGDKGASSNVGGIFVNHKIYEWAVDNLTNDVVSE